MTVLKFSVICVLLLAQSSWGWDSSVVYKDGNGRLVYESDEKGNRLADFSHAGYHAGEDALPNVPVVLTISPVAGDNTAHIQAAINTLAARPSFDRGAILLTKGTYEVSGVLYINADGIVLRGEGNGNTANDTIVIGTGTNQRKEQGIILIQSNSSGFEVEPGTLQNVVSEFLPIGSRTIEVENGALYAVGDYLIIRHDPSEAWLEAINYGNVDGDEAVWVAGQNDLKMYFHGTVTAISGNKIKLDTPIYHPLDRSLSQSVVYRLGGSGPVTECGVENMRVISQNSGGTDESHRWDCVHFIGARNCWAKDTISVGFAESGFRFSKTTRTTVLRCQAIDPVSKIEGGRRYNFYVGEHSHDVLVKDSLATKGRHCFVGNGAASVSGAVFSQCESRNTYASSENHRRWGSGFLWDDVEWNNVNSSVYTVLALYNRGNNGTSHGWTGTGLVAWNISAPGKYVMCSEPPVGQNFAIGCNSGITGGSYPVGHVEGTGQSLSIPSLYAAQLSERLTYGVGPDAPARLKVSHYVNTASPFVVLEWDDLALDETAYVLERSSNGGSSYSVLATLPADTEHYTDTTVAQNGSYIYRLKATNAIGSSAYGNTASVQLPADELPVAVTYQAEDFTGQSGAGIRWDRHGFSGFGYVDINGPATWIELEIDGGMGGPTPVTFRFGAGETYDRPCIISINGVPKATSSFASSGSWDAWRTETIVIDLDRGLNTLRIQPNGTANGPNLDKVEVQATPVLYAAGGVSGDTGAEKAFDGDVNTIWKHHSPYGSWIQLAQVGALEVIEYSLTSGSGLQANDPKSWILWGSNDDGATWTSVDTRSNVLFPGRKQTRTFPVSSLGDYALYRLEITEVRDISNADSVQLAELQMNYSSLPPVTPNPARFSVVPHPVSETEIAMTSVTGSSSIGTVEYYFDEVSGNAGGTDSGWIQSPSYTDSGLTSGLEYRYSVTMRDLPGNETTASAALTAVPFKQTTTVWNGGGTSDGLWTTGGNWTGGGVAPMLPEQYKKVVFNVNGAKECVLNTSATVAHLVVGDNGTTTGNFLRLTDGANLLAGYKPGNNPEWTAVGYNRSATVTVESGAVLETAGQLYIARVGGSQTSLLDINGGTVNAATAIELGNASEPTSTGTIVVDGGGLLTGASLSFRDAASTIDLRKGTLILNGNHVSTINGFITDGKIVTDGQPGTFSVDYNTINSERTTVVAVRTVPGVEGLSQAAAESAIMSAGLVVGDISTVSSETMAAGGIVAQDPAGGSTLAHGAAVNLTVSLGPLAAQTTTRWRGAISDAWAPGINWSGGAAPFDKVQNLKTVFDGGTTQQCVLETAAVVAQLVLGDNGPQIDNVLRLTAGADLTCGLKPDNSTVWTGVGYNRPATMILESGAKMTTSGHLWVGNFAPSEAALIVDGGSVEVKGMLGLGWNQGTGILNIKNGGTLHSSGFDAARSISSNSTINIDAGSLVLNGNQVNAVNAYIASGRMTAYHGASSLLVNHNTGTDKTTVTAVPFGFDEWASEQEEDIGASDHDFDGDLRNNLYEYAFNGDPCDRTNLGTEPVLESVGGLLRYIHLQRNDDPNLIYRVETTTNLVSGSWVDAGDMAIGTNIMGDGALYNEVTNAVPATEDKIFIRLNVNLK